ncbi:uncharacterized protein LOC129581629 [Paramacrobiotus metropolitanus]|uniref:uncharacterized protein LOC129581629 n=1 Tax=Paramacrobiotus metropolitanus TaxID=2943436 RepID=UPI002445EF11|nr:uncharacterized protein LOC129581629 [Paramacrobiotus metropolitanus]
MNADEVQNVTDYFDGIITATNPDINAIAPLQHPSGIRPTAVADWDTDYVNLVNKVQRHTMCKPETCLKKVKKSGPEKCRFDFPQKLLAVSTLCATDGKWGYTPKRNDPRVNRHNRGILQAWRANVDVSAITDKQAVINYVAKYASKGEPRSATYAEIFRTILDAGASGSDKARKSIQKLLTKSISERDISAQECMHLLMGHDLYRSSRSFVNITLKNDEWVPLTSVKTDDDSPEGQGKTILEKYKLRIPEMEGLSLFEVASKYSWSRQNWRKRAANKEAVVRVFP